MLTSPLSRLISALSTLCVTWTLLPGCQEERPATPPQTQDHLQRVAFELPASGEMRASRIVIESEATPSPADGQALANMLYLATRGCPEHFSAMREETFLRVPLEVGAQGGVTLLPETGEVEAYKLARCVRKNIQERQGGVTLSPNPTPRRLSLYISFKDNAHAPPK